MKNKKYLYSFLAIIFSTLPTVALAQWNMSNVATQSNLPTGTIYQIITNIMLWLLGIVGVIGVIGFVIAGILYLTAAGDEGKMELGKNAMTWSIIGVIVALMGYVIIQAVNSMLGGTNTIF